MARQPYTYSLAFHLVLSAATGLIERHSYVLPNPDALAQSETQNPSLERRLPSGCLHVSPQFFWRRCGFTLESDNFQRLTDLASGLLLMTVAKEFVSKGEIVSKNTDLNTATEQELTVIQGIGKDNAKKIVQHRLQNGSFKTWEDLRRVPGLPPHLLDTLKRSGFTVGERAA